jgi:hypothetical protein
VTKLYLIQGGARIGRWPTIASRANPCDLAGDRCARLRRPGRVRARQGRGGFACGPTVLRLARQIGRHGLRAGRQCVDTPGKALESPAFAKSFRDYLGLRYYKLW